MFQTSTLFKFFLRKNAAKLLLLLLCCFVGVVESYAQIDSRYIIDHDGPWQNVNTANLKALNLGTDYTTTELGDGVKGGSAKFQNSGGTLTIETIEAIGQISFFLKSSGFGTYTNNLKVQEWNGTAWVTIKDIYTPSTDIKGTKYFAYPSSTARKVQLIYSQLSGGSAIALDKLVVEKEAEISITQVSDVPNGGTYSFGGYDIGTSSGAKTFTIGNTGLGTLYLTGSPKIAISGAHSSDFSINQNLTTSSIAPGGNTSFEISFNPSASGVRTATISIANNDGDEAPYTFTLNGTGLGAPIITSFSPTSGPEGTSVTISGQLFTGATSVSFNGTSASFTVVSDTEITAIVPDGARSGLISITTPGGTGVSAEQFTVILTPAITSFDPMAGPEGSLITIAGKYFLGATSVSFNGTSASFTVVSDTEITATVPNGATTGLIAITTPDGTAISTEEYTVLYPPTITSFDPTQGLIGTTVTITGTLLRDASAVYFNGTPADNFLATSDTEILVEVPAGATTGPITVESPGGTATSADPFVVLFAPTIISFDPMQGPVGTVVTITGTYLQDASAVYFNGTPASNFLATSDTEVMVEVPAGATTGLITIDTPGGTATSADPFTVFAPTITSFDPTQGPIGTTVTITGTRLIDASAVYFNGTPASNFLATSDTTVMVDVPVGATTGLITIDTPEGTATSANPFTVLVPTITSFDPTQGPVGTVVTITGILLQDASAVYFNGTPASNFLATSDTEVMVEVPAGATTGLITIDTPGGTATSADPFTVFAPTITSFDPTQGPIGTTVTITGTRLIDASAVYFNGTPASNFLATSDTTVMVDVPVGATTGLITIETPEGVASSTENFVVRNQKIFLSATEMAFGSVQAGGEYVKEYQVSASGLVDGATILLSMNGSPGLYTMSESQTDGFARTLDMTHLIQDNSLEPTYVYVKYSPIDAGTYNATIDHTTEDADVEVMAISGTAIITPLPVELMSFNAALHNNNVLLTWVTASEENNSHFEVEMSNNPKNGFEKIGRVDSKVTNSVLRTDYEFTHKLGNETGTIYYRLKQVDTDGTTDYSKVVAINVKSRVALQQLMVAPNPINYNTKVFVSAEVSGKANLVMHSMTGQKVYNNVVELQAGQNEVQLPVYDKLTKGMYVLTVELNGQVSQIKVIKE
ncbi:IPT/TIG domain-containing protein [Pontibacter anaerobius]|uniref:IPT/TIG domain-containing protein n=1 Tax=Pontibacter anaerobius TaxID=2993940 RepID=A0ABT3RGK8_9BACT|nr:IPT/TIG domain-containing protein [Pontibacter anaerobius]MCX2740613.1 IPT/TIG domain-containing protein [Pontibacter anaerobius]